MTRRPLALFQTAPQATPVTLGVDCAVLDLTNGKTLIWFDMEGLNNEDRPDLTMTLGILTQLTPDLIYVDHRLNDTLRSSLFRLIAAGTVIIDGAMVTWPKLHVILNQSRIQVTDADLTRKFAPSELFSDADSQVIFSLSRL